MGTRMLQRRGTSAEWAAANPVLGDGELGLDRDTGVIKVGDGVTAWLTLTNIYRRFVDSVAKAGDTMTGLLIAPKLRVTGATAEVLIDDRDGTGQFSMYDNAGVLRFFSNGADRLSLTDTGDLNTSGTVSENGQRVYSPNNLQPITNPVAIVDAKGDLLVGTADNTVARVPVGNTDQVLVADPATASGVRWSTPATGASFGFAEVFLHGGS